MKGEEQWRVGIEDFAMSFTAGRWVNNILPPKVHPSYSRMANMVLTNIIVPCTSHLVCLSSPPNQVQYTFSIQAGSD